MKINLVDKNGNLKPLTAEEAEFIMDDVARGYGFLLKRMFSRSGAASLPLSVMGATRKIAGKQPIFRPGERRGLFRALFDFDLEAVEYSAGPVSIRIQAGLNVHEQVRTLVALNQYRISPDNMRGKAVVDAGANIGMFSILAGRMGAKKVYAFEPIRGNFEYLSRNIQLNGLEGTVVPINKALGGRNETREIHCSGFADDHSASFENVGSLKAMQTVEVVSVDSFAKGKIDFIKMDVEGYEKEVIEGARETIRRDSPLLSFSVYHKENDRATLPRILKEINPSYSCEVREDGEPVAFCSPGVKKPE